MKDVELTLNRSLRDRILTILNHEIAYIDLNPYRDEVEPGASGDQTLRSFSQLPALKPANPRIDIPRISLANKIDRLIFPNEETIRLVTITFQEQIQLNIIYPDSLHLN